jgi:hypothetical protein
MSGMRAFRAVAAAAAVGAAVLAAPVAEAAGPYTIDAEIYVTAGPPAAPTYQYPTIPAGTAAPTSFRWNEPFEVSFTHYSDASSAALMGLAQGKKDIASVVVHEALNGTAVVTLALTGVHVDVVHAEGNVNNANGPEETVVLRCRSVTYTYQPVTAAGQKNGPPVSITYTRAAFDHDGR